MTQMPNIPLYTPRARPLYNPLVSLLLPTTPVYSIRLATQPVVFYEANHFHPVVFLGGKPPNPQGRLRRVLGNIIPFCEAEKPHDVLTAIWTEL
jgi:hypothetical protein